MLRHSATCPADRDCELAHALTVWAAGAEGGLSGLSAGATSMNSWRNAQPLSTVTAHPPRPRTALPAAGGPGTDPLTPPTAGRRMAEGVHRDTDRTGPRRPTAPPLDALGLEKQSRTAPVSGVLSSPTPKGLWSKLAPTRTVATSSCAMRGTIVKAVRLISTAS